MYISLRPNNVEIIFVVKINQQCWIILKNVTVVLSTVLPHSILKFDTLFFNSEFRLGLDESIFEFEFEFEN